MKTQDMHTEDTLNTIEAVETTETSETLTIQTGVKAGDAMSDVYSAVKPWWMFF